MGTSVAVAQAICERLGLVDAGRLQKLTYYCQAWSLGWFGRPLFAQDFRAGQDGPVEPGLFEECLAGRSGWFSPRAFGAVDDSLDARDVAVVDAVVDFYGGMTHRELMGWVCADQPWISARAGVGCEVGLGGVVSQRAMKRFYGLAEARHMDGPRRPFVQVREVSGGELQARLDATTERWGGVLEGLARR
ncbi:Panacea domain-containing protein [Corynebacterium camporealensis]